MFQSPYGDFGFRNSHSDNRCESSRCFSPLTGILGLETTALKLLVLLILLFQSPYGDFGFRNPIVDISASEDRYKFQSPYGDFGFRNARETGAHGRLTNVSVPLRGFWV